MVLKEVRWELCDAFDCLSRKDIAQEIDKDTLIKGLKAGIYEVPKCEPECQLLLRYLNSEGDEVFISAANYTSDNQDEHFTCNTNDLVFLKSVETDMDIVFDYYEEMHSGDSTITQEDYCANI